MTALKLQSHWSAQIPFPGPRIVSKFTRPFSLAELEGGVWARDYVSHHTDISFAYFDKAALERGEGDSELIGSYIKY